MSRLIRNLIFAIFLVPAWGAGAAVMTYGDKDVLGVDSYSSEPTDGATLEGLTTGVVTTANLSFRHSFPFDPEPEDYPGTDQIFVSSTQTTDRDGYSRHPGRLSAPHNIALDYSSLIGPGERVETLTLGIAADDFEFPLFGQVFTATINGGEDKALITKLNELRQTGPRVQFFSIGINPSALTPDHQLLLSIDQVGDGRDGWAIDFLTIGVTTTAIPLPPALPLMAITMLLLRVRRSH